jgi:hypothetical protein
MLSWLFSRFDRPGALLAVKAGEVARIVRMR